MTPNVLLVVLDTVRARNTSLHGHERETTPFLESLAAEATVYEQARAPGIRSLESHASIFTGYHVVQHRLKDVDQRLEPGHTVWEDLAGDGYETGVFSYNSYLTQAPVGLKDAFDTVESGEDQRVPFPEAFDPTNLRSTGSDRYREFAMRAARNDHSIKSILNGISLWDATKSLLPSPVQGYEVVPDHVFTDLFLEWEADCDGPWAACVNYMGAHSPYFPRPEHNKWAGERQLQIMREVEDHAWSFVAGRRPWSDRTELEHLYDGCIHQVDAELERLVGALRDRGVLDETLLVVTSDHGEGFGERGEVRPARSVAHGKSGGLEEWILHVPLLVRRPGQRRGERIADAATLTAFPETVRSIRDGEVDRPTFVPGDDPVLASSFEFTDGDHDRVPSYVTDVSAYDQPGRAVYRTTDDGQMHKYVEVGDERRVFDCTDPQSTDRLSDDPGSVIENAFAELSMIDIVTGDSAELTDDVKDRLAELGYR